jgi:hypothetical protein
VPVRLAAVLTTLAVAVLGFAPVAAAAPASDVCVINDSRAIELSGLIATASGFMAVNDGNFDATKVRIFTLDRNCKVTSAQGYPTAARDPEDLAVAPDGAIWVGDTGDNITAETHRQTIALWRLPSGGGAPVINRLTYPDGPHDAEAVLFGGDGLPVIVTKEVGRAAALYKPTTALVPNTAAGVPMTKVGEFLPEATGAENPLGMIGELAVTGAATAPDRHRVTLRTYTAAYEWDVPDGDIVKAITTATPRVTPLPNELQGEAIAYTSDGTAFLTVSDRADGPVTIRRIAPSTTPMVRATPAPPSPAAAAAPAQAPSWFSAVPLWLSIPVGVGGLLLLTFGFLSLRRSRRAESASDPLPSS